MHELSVQKHGQILIIYCGTRDDLMCLCNLRNFSQWTFRWDPHHEAINQSDAFKSHVATNALEIITHPNIKHLDGIYQISHHWSNGEHTLCCLLTLLLNSFITKRRKTD